VAMETGLVPVGNGELAPLTNIGIEIFLRQNKPFALQSRRSEASRPILTMQIAATWQIEY
jgi:hypothetical protein